MESNHTRLFLIRHGQVVGHKRPTYNGRTDVDLTDLGKAQARAAAEELRDVDLSAVYSSDLKRARYGGEYLAGIKNVELRIEPDFREIDFGEWEGLTFDEVEKRWPGELDRRFNNMADHVIPGAETIRDVWIRTGAALERLLAAHPNESVALVAHSGVNRAILLQTLDAGPEMIWRMDQDFGCLNVIDYFPDGRKMIRATNIPNRADGSVPNRYVAW